MKGKMSNGMYVDDLLSITYYHGEDFIYTLIFEGV